MKINTLKLFKAVRVVVMLLLFGVQGLTRAMSQVVPPGSFDTHWPGAHLYNDFGSNDALVAFAQIDGNYITSDNYASMEIAAFVGDECRGHTFMNYYPEAGDPYPIVEFSIYYNNSGEEISFRLFDHLEEIEYDITSSVPKLTVALPFLPTLRRAAK